MEVDRVMAASGGVYDSAPKAVERKASTEQQQINLNAAAEQVGGAVKSATERPVAASSKSGSEADKRQDQEQDSLSKKVIEQATENANKAIIQTGRRIELSVHEKTHRIMARVVDSETGEVVREVPSKEALDFLTNVLEQAGILVDKKG